MKLLLAIDGSKYSDAAVTEISLRQWPPHSEIRLITVLRPIEANSLAGSSLAVLGELNKAQREEAVRLLEAAASVFKQNSSGIHINTVVRQGCPKKSILDEAESWKADLIVVASRRKGVLPSFLMGSVSSAIASDALCSVEIVRPPPPRRLKQLADWFKGIIQLIRRGCMNALGTRCPVLSKSVDKPSSFRSLCFSPTCRLAACGKRNSGQRIRLERDPRKNH